MLSGLYLKYFKSGQVYFRIIESQLSVLFCILFLDGDEGEAQLFGGDENASQGSSGVSSRYNLSISSYNELRSKLLTTFLSHNIFSSGKMFWLKSMLLGINVAAESSFRSISDDGKSSTEQKSIFVYR